MTEDRIILIDKPLTWTSFEVVKKVRQQLKIKKVGHAGTLDPLATGLLIVCTGKATKQIASLQEQEKEYVGTILIGQTTPSYDRETAASPKVDISHIDTDMIRDKAARFIGKSQQVPPAYSAVKVNGKRAYTMARKGQNPKLNPREVNISRFDITVDALPRINFRVICSKGTYIRSLAKDLGEALGVGGHLAALQRTRIGDFLLKDAISPDQL